MGVAVPVSNDEKLSDSQKSKTQPRTRTIHTIHPLPDINGWALTGTRSKRKHAVVKPRDLGDKGPALCGKLPNTKTGWTEHPDGNARLLRCEKCCVLIVDAIGSI